MRILVESIKINRSNFSSASIFLFSFLHRQVKFADSILQLNQLLSAICLFLRLSRSILNFNDLDSFFFFFKKKEVVVVTIFISFSVNFALAAQYMHGARLICVCIAQMWKEQPPLYRLVNCSIYRYSYAIHLFIPTPHM